MIWKRSILVFFMLLIVYLSSVFASAEGVLTLPADLTIIEDHAFENVRGFQKVIIPEGIKSIGRRAFASSSLLEITLPQSIESMAVDAFDGISESAVVSVYYNSVADQILSSTAVPFTVRVLGAPEFWDYYSLYTWEEDDELTVIVEGWAGEERLNQLVFSETYKGKPIDSLIIQNNSFYADEQLTKPPLFPSCLTEIRDCAFRYCSNMKGELILPNGLKRIGFSAFEECNGLTGSLSIPSTVTEIDSDAFAACGFNGTLTLMEGLNRVQSGAFSRCGFTGALVLPDGLSYIGASAFERAPFTGSLTIPQSVQTIEQYAFSYCSFDGNLTLPDGLEEISTGAFEHVPFTGPLVIPDSVKQIGRSAFSGERERDSWYSSLHDVDIHPFNGTLKLSNSLQTIESLAFFGCGFTGSLIIPDTVTEIEEYAFSSCEGFNETLKLSSSLSEIHESVFYNCNGFSGSLVIPDSVTKIDESAFSDCSGFNGTLTLSKSLKSIGKNAFGGCSGFTASLAIPNSVTRLEQFAFRDCSGFNGTLTLSKNIRVWLSDEVDLYTKGSMFIGCSGFKKVIIPYGITEIPENMFKDCTGLVSVSMGNSVTDIQDYAFDGCISLKKLQFSSHLRIISKFAFRNCKNLTGILRLSSLEATLSDGAFQGCSGLSGAYLSDNAFDSGFDNRFVFEPDKAYGAYSKGTFPFYGCSNRFTIYCRQDTYTDIVCRQYNLRYMYLNISNSSAGLPNGTCAYGEAHTLSGYFKAPTDILKIRGTIINGQTQSIIQRKEVDVNASVVYFSILNGHVKFEELPLGNYLFQIEIYIEGDSEYWTIAESEFEIKKTTVQGKRTTDYTVPVGLYGTGTGFISSGSLVFNRIVEQAIARIVNTKTNDTVFENVITPEPQTRIITSASLLNGFAMQFLPVGTYRYVINVTLEGTIHELVESEFMIFNYDGNIDEGKAKEIIQFCSEADNRIIFNRYLDYADYLDSIDAWDEIAMAASNYEDIIVSGIIELVTGSGSNGYVKKLYKKQIVKMMESFDESTGENMKLMDDYEEFALKMIKDGGKIEGFAVDLDKNMISQEALEYITDEYRKIYADAVKEFDSDVMDVYRAYQDELEYIDELKGQLKDLGGVVNCVGYGTDALTIISEAMKNHEKGLVAIASLSEAYGDNVPEEFREALDEVLEEYQSEAILIIRKAFSKIEEGFTKELLSVGEDGLVLFGQWLFEVGDISLTFKITKFVVNIGLDLFGIKDDADSKLDFVTMMNLMLESKKAYVNAFDDVFAGDTSSSKLNQVYYAFEATKQTLKDIYDFLLDETDDPSYYRQLEEKHTNLYDLKIY